jgi:hypothetical protein
MKNSLIAIIIGSFLVLGSTIEHKRSDALISDKQMMIGQSMDKLSGK